MATVPMNADPAGFVLVLLSSLEKGQYLVLAEAIAQAGGEVRLPLDFFKDVSRAAPKLVIDADDGAIVLRLLDEG